MLTRLEHFASEAMQAMITLLRGSSMSDEQLARRAFEIASAMEAEAVKHNPADRTEARSVREAAEMAHEFRVRVDAARQPASS